MSEKKLGLPSVIGAGVGLIVATSCLLSLGQGSGTLGTPFIISMIIACILNILTALSIAELGALMPNLTGGLAQYTLACMGPFVTLIAMVGGYIACNTIVASAECAMFGNTISSVLPGVNIPPSAYCIALLGILIIVNLRGVDMFAKIQNFVAYGLIISLTLMGIIGIFKIGTGDVVVQEAALSTNFTDITSFCGLAFFLFIGCEYIVPISNQVKNARRNIPLGMILSLLIVCVMQIILIFGFKNYVLWSDLAGSTTPHVLYGMALLGKWGTVWMAVVSILAVTSSVNTVISALAYICAGMAKIGLLPSVFMKTNKRGVPYVGILTIGGVMIIVNGTGLSTSDQLSFVILTGCVFWMISYVIAHINVLILRHRLPKAPRTFKVPGGAVLPIVGIIGDIWMIYNIDSNPDTRMSIYKICLIIFAVLAVYTVTWIKCVMKKPMFKAIPLEEVMAMENSLYQVYHNPKMRKELALMRE